jgi:hypothetical protein
MWQYAQEIFIHHLSFPQSKPIKAALIGKGRTRSSVNAVALPHDLMALF